MSGEEFLAVMEGKEEGAASEEGSPAPAGQEESTAGGTPASENHSEE